MTMFLNGNTNICNSLTKGHQWLFISNLKVLRKQTGSYIITFKLLCINI